MPIIQNFSVPAGDDVDVNFVLDADTPVVLAGATIYWNVYEQTQGIADKSKLVISKSTISGITIPGSPDEVFVVSITQDDTTDMMRNYYHEAKIVDANDNHITVTVGIMTVTEVEFRSSP